MSMKHVNPTAHEKFEWRRFARALLAAGYTGVGGVVGAYGAMPDGSRIDVTRYDELQAQYRAWLVFGRMEEPPVNLTQDMVREEDGQ